MTGGTEPKGVNATVFFDILKSLEAGKGSFLDGLWDSSYDFQIEPPANNPDPLRCPAPSGQGLRWRAWPCPKCNSGLTAIGVLVRSAETDSPILDGDPDGIASKKMGLLLDWVDRCEHTDEQRIWFPKIAEGSEHEVFLSDSDARVYKATLPGTFGELSQLM